MLEMFLITTTPSLIGNCGLPGNRADAALYCSMFDGLATPAWFIQNAIGWLQLYVTTATHTLTHLTKQN